ncbi:hypothetical protein WKV44_04845 [Spirochaetia bacterium 38H-sp]|uniref:Flagellar hook-length control protein FliK n=1 Tax=Rarispira pelagica TaxID=3141764 RepID=A0ABU9UBJ9_9SPIR
MQIRFTPELRLLFDNKRIRQGSVVSFSVLSDNKNGKYIINLFGKKLSVKSGIRLSAGECYKAVVEQKENVLLLRLLDTFPASDNKVGYSLSLLLKLINKSEINLSSSVVSILYELFDSGRMDLFDLNAILMFMKKGLSQDTENIRHMIAKLKKYFSSAGARSKSKYEISFPAFDNSNNENIIAVFNSLSLGDDIFWTVPIRVSNDNNPAKMACVKKKGLEYYIIDIDTVAGQFLFAIFLKPVKKIEASLPKMVLERYGQELSVLKEQLLKNGYDSFFYESEAYTFVDGAFISMDAFASVDIRV